VRKIILFLFFLADYVGLFGQSGGGGVLFNQLNVANTPQLLALGGINISQQSRDIGMGFHNPALLRPSMHGQAGFVFHSYLGGINAYHTQWGMYSPALATVFSAGVQFFDYGTIQQTDAAGNGLGTLRPSDQLIQLSASRAYMQRWHYGVSLKWLRSLYGIYRASGVALDVGVTYTDSSNGWQMGLTMINMGAVINKFSGTEAASLPFDIRAGVSKKLENAPLQLSASWHHVHRFRLLEDPVPVDATTAAKPYGFASQLLSHLVLSAQWVLAEKIECTIGYNFLRRTELNAGLEGNGLNGFSMGAGVLLKRWQLRYARSYYLAGRGTSMLGISMGIFK